MILTKQNIKAVDIDFMIDKKLRTGEINEILFIVPTKRKIRYLSRELISLSPGKSVYGLSIETIGSFTENLLEEIEGRLNRITEEASILMLSHAFKKIKLKYFSQYKDQIPFGTLEKVKNVIAEYKRQGISVEKLNLESKKLSGSEKLKAQDIASVYGEYQNSLFKNNFCEIGDIYSRIINKGKKELIEAFDFLYPEVKTIIINGFDEFTAPEVEIINRASKFFHSELFILLDYYKYNPLIFSHLDKCHDNFTAKSFSEVNDTSQAVQNKFLKVVRENLSLKKLVKKEYSFHNSVMQINALSREEEVELIAKEIKRLILTEQIEPDKICVVFNLIGNYSTIIRDRFNLFGIPFNLTDRFSLSTSPPVKAILSLLEIHENDYYYKNIFRAFSSTFLSSIGIEISSLLKTSVELKLISGFENWISKITAAVDDLSSTYNKYNNYSEKLKVFKKALTDLRIINSQLKQFSDKINPDEFRDRLLQLIFQLNFPKILLDAQPDVVENDSIAFNSFLKVLNEITELLKLEYGADKKFTLHFYLNQLRTTVKFARYNIPEKPGFGIQITTLNEIRGLNFDYLFIGGLNDGDLPTKFAPEVFYSGSFAKEELKHQIEQRYLFYQSLCTWNKRLYLSFPQTDGKRDLVQSSFLKDFTSLFETRTISNDDFKTEIYSKEELLKLLGKISKEQRNEFKFPDEIDIDIKSINNSIEIDKKRIEEPFGESAYSGHIIGEISAELKSKLKNITEGEFSATQLETYSKCPYKYFVENILKLETIEEPVEELEAFEYGSLIHSILFEFYTKLKDQKIILIDCDDFVFKTAEELLFKIAESKFDELKLNPEYSFYEREKLLGINGERNQSLLYKFLEEERNGEPGYVPEFFELSFGRVGNEKKTSMEINEAVSTDGIKLKGKIDRIDINEDAKTYKVIDYKLGGKKPTSEELLTGISLQLPLYLYAAKELIKRELEKDYNPVEAQIFSLKFKEDDFGLKTVNLKSGRTKTQEVNEQVANAEEMIKICLEMINKFASEIAQGKFNLSTLKNREAKVCKFCDFKRICRIQEVD